MLPVLDEEPCKDDIECSVAEFPSLVFYPCVMMLLKKNLCLGQTRSLAERLLEKLPGIPALYQLLCNWPCNAGVFQMKHLFRRIAGIFE